MMERRQDEGLIGKITILVVIPTPSQPYSEHPSLLSFPLHTHICRDFPLIFRTLLLSLAILFVSMRRHRLILVRLL